MWCRALFARDDTQMLLRRPPHPTSLTLGHLLLQEKAWPPSAANGPTNCNLPNRELRKKFTHYILIFSYFYSMILLQNMGCPETLHTNGHHKIYKMKEVIPLWQSLI
jgi:hypothetical protein